MNNLNEFMPHGFCIAWNPQLLTMHVVSDILIALAYFSIPIGIVYVARKRANTQLQPIYYLFAGFILACGVTHVMGVVTLWVPLYYTQGWSKVVTAIISVVTAIFVLLRLGKIMSLPNLDELTELNSSLKRSEQIALDAQKTQATFMSNMSHELRTPMNGIIGALDLLKKTVLSRDQFHLTAIARQSAYSLLTLLNDILDLSKIESGKFELREESTNLPQILEDVGLSFSFESDRKNLELICPLAAVPEIVYRSDPQRIRQVLLNLVGNAIKFTDSGHVSVSCKEIKYEADVAWVEFVVEDTGIGIAPSDQSKLFQRFKQLDDSSTRKAGGTGLGLVIVKELIEIMGGEIDLQSQVGLGTKISFTLPLKREKGDSAKARPIDHLNINEQEPVHLALSHPLVLNMVSSVLESHGCQVINCNPESLSAMVAQLNSGQKLIVSTQFLKTNPESVKILGDLNDGVRCLMIATSAELADPEFTVPAWVDTTITKPVSQRVIADWLVVNEVVQDEEEGSAVKDTESVKFEGRVLVVEDAPMNQMIIRAILSKFGISPVVANNGQEAIEVLHRSQFDLILMDGQMPILDGYETTRRIRSSDPSVINTKVPIIALTAHAMKGEREKCLSAGMDDYLTKPIDINELLQALSKYLKKA